MTNIQKEEIKELIRAEKNRLGTFKAVAVKCKVSEPTISQLLNDAYLAKGDDMLLKIGLALGYRFDDGSWQIAETTDFKIVTGVLDDAKHESMFIGISDVAGSGKTSAADVYLESNRRNSVYKINCKDWSGREFLLAMAKEIGAEMPKGYVKVSDLISSISATVKKISSSKPLVIIDQANSLKASALRTLIHIYNECEDILGIVIMGAESLEYEIKKGVRLNRTGYDEIDSRFGRKYVKLVGATASDARMICKMNGIEDAALQDTIFRESEPVHHTLSGGRQILVIKDKRRLKRIIKRERLRLKQYGS